MYRARTVASILIVVLALVSLLWVPTITASPLPRAPERPLAVNANDYFDSGWLAVPKGTCKPITHGLGGNPNNFAVELSFQDEANAGRGIHRRGYGGLDVNSRKQGAHWQRLESNTIELCRGADAAFVDRMRVRVFVPVPSSTMAQSAWKTILPGTTSSYNHKLNTPPIDLTVGLWFKDLTPGPTNIGIHQLGYGGLPINATMDFTGAHWHNLTNNYVSVTRHPDDKRVGQVRFTVVKASKPDYDSFVDLGSWKPIAAGGSYTFKHKLNWNPEMLLVRGECLWPAAPGPPTEWGIHNGLVGGSVATWAGGAKGTNMQRLRKDTVEVERWANDDICPQVRVRIWKRMMQVYVPLAVLNDG